jgi:hypothetical protein
MLRKRKNKRYNEETNDDDDDRVRRYNIKDKIRSERFGQLKDLQELPGDQVTLKLIQRHGFDKPILVTSPEGLDLSVPSKDFVVRDVGKLVGYDRLIDVMDVRTQKNIEMTMRDWCKYYESSNRDRLLNVISLEFSHTELANKIDSPKIVKLLDWVDLVWPKFLKESQTESTNTIDKMKYPKVQKYCLMSVKGSYTDFHIDFGGTSVWYHILRGKKIFWMAPPTELNLQAFEEWTLSGMQQDVFFGDTVEECFRVELTAGNTFFIPSGWIHAVYTLEDSLVFGGNFLHSFGIENQLKVSRIEDATKVPVKFRYPFYTEILWYVVQHYVHCLTGKCHLQNSPKNSATTTPEKNSKTIDEPKSSKKRSKVVNDDSATESDYDDSDRTKRKRANTLTPQKKLRGRPPKQEKPPTDDESTEIDSDYEVTKHTKNTTTCRMTKNSLLRLQYELEEPQVPIDRPKPSPNKQTKSSKDEGISKEAKTKTKSNIKKSPKTQELPVKSEIDSKHDLQSLSSSTVKANAHSSESPNLVPLTEASPLCGWSGANKTIWSNPDSEAKVSSKIHITKTELNGLKLIVKHLSKLSGAKKNMPNLIRNSRSLLDDCKKVILEHENDDPELAVTGVPITPDLLNPKKSDISQLIEQFFRPNLNNEVSSDKGDSDLPLPGSFAGLIAATSTKKEMFNVNSADVTSSLFGLKSPSKTTSTNNSSPSVCPTSVLASSKSQSIRSKILAAQPTSPPARSTSPPVRPTLPTARPAPPVQRPASPPVRPTLPTARPAPPVQRPASPPVRPTLPTARPAPPAQRPASPPVRTTLPTPRPTPPVQRPASPPQVRSTPPSALSTPPPPPCPASPPARSTVKLECPTATPERPTLAQVRPTLPPARPFSKKQYIIRAENERIANQTANSLAEQVPATQTDSQVKQPDNAALLSLATTALSTAPLPTTPTLSNVGSRLANPAPAFLVNPNLFAAQQYYNPYMHQIPMVQFEPKGATRAALITGTYPRPGLPRPTGQLLFAPLINQPGQPRYLITQPGLMPHRPQVAPLYSAHQPATTLSFAAFQSAVGLSSPAGHSAPSPAMVAAPSLVLGAMPWCVVPFNRSAGHEFADKPGNIIVPAHGVGHTVPQLPGNSTRSTLSDAGARATR